MRLGCNFFVGEFLPTQTHGFREVKFLFSNSGKDFPFNIFLQLNPMGLVCKRIFPNFSTSKFVVKGLGYKLKNLHF